MKQEFLKYFEAYLAKLRKEVEAFTDDETFWGKGEGINNSPGNLTLHLLGNLNHYIGAKLGNSGYVRNRDLEFSSGPQPRQNILDRIDQTRAVVVGTIAGLSEDDLSSDYPADEGDDVQSVSAELVAILSHFTYHLGQINYYRRLSPK
jgi:hypothetical protein